MELIYKILLKPHKKSEYHLPPLNSPRVILDIGANIGVTTLLLAEKYPSAAIYAFEPIQGNIEILRQNTKNIPRATVLPFGLGSEDSTQVIFSSDNPTNFGGFSQFARGVNASEKSTITIRNAQTCLQELEVKSVDLIKIDTEGAECSILRSFDPELLQSARFILGELHGERDGELIDYLSRWFTLQWNQDPNSRLSTFTATRRLA